MKPQNSRVDPVQICLGYSAFQSTAHCLITQYRQQVGRCRKKAVFNVRHSDARVKATEHIYRYWKDRWRVLQNGRVQVKHFQAI